MVGNVDKHLGSWSHSHKKTYKDVVETKEIISKIHTLPTIRRKWHTHVHTRHMIWKPSISSHRDLTFQSPLRFSPESKYILTVCKLSNLRIIGLLPQREIFLLYLFIILKKCYLRNLSYYELLVLGDSASVQKSSFNSKLPLIILIHGFHNSFKTDFTQSVKNGKASNRKSNS